MSALALSAASAVVPHDAVPHEAVPQEADDQ
jgi:hypothetical protein